MPLKTDRLTKKSSKEAVQKAISDDISMLVKEGRPQKRAIAIVMSNARENAGAAKVSRKKK